MIKKLFASTVFFLILLLTLPLLTTHIALNKLFKDYQSQFKFAHFLYDNSSGLKIRIYDLNLESEGSAQQLDSTNKIFIKTLDVFINWKNLSLKGCQIFGLDFHLNEKKYLEKGQGQIMIDAKKIIAHGHAVPFELNTRKPLEFSFEVQTQGEINGLINLTLPPFPYQDYNFTFQPLTFEFDEKQIILKEQKALSINGSYLHLQGIYEIEREHIDFLYNIEQLQTKQFPDIEWLIETTLHGEGKGFINWQDGLNYQCQTSLLGAQGLFFPFNPDFTKEQMNFTNLFRGSGDNNPEKLFSFDKSKIDFTFEPGKLTIDLFDLEKKNNILSCKGHYLLDQSYEAKVLYKKMGSLSPLSFSIKGQGEDYEIYLDSTDVLNAVPELILPNINKFFQSFSN